MKYKLRPWSYDDIESLTKYANNLSISKNLRNGFPYPYTKDDALNFLKRTVGDEMLQKMAIEINGEACGGAGVFQQTDIHIKNAELGYWLAEPYWGNGIMTSVVKDTVERGFNTFDINRIFAIPFGPNIASHRVLEKAGFKLEGRFEKTIYKNGEFLDELVYAIRK